MTEAEDTGMLSLGTGILRTCLNVSIPSVHWEGNSDISTSLYIGQGKVAVLLQLSPFEPIRVPCKKQRDGVP